MWVQMASFRSFNQLSYDRKQRVVETGDLNPHMASTAICYCIAQLVREDVSRIGIVKARSFQGSLPNC